MRVRYIADIGPPVEGFARANEGDPVSFLPLENIWADGRFDPSTEVRFSGDVGSYNPVAEGDVILPKVAPTFARGRAVVATGLVGRRALATSEVFVLRPRNPRAARFLTYRFRARDFLTQGVASWTGVAGLKRVSAEFVRNVDIDPRAWARGEAIADFLDAECDRIGSLVRSLQDLSPLSAEVALNVIESRWEDFPFARIGRRFEVQLGKKLYEDRIDHRTAKPYLRIANVYWDRFDLSDVKVMNFEGRESEFYELRAGDLLVCEGRGLGRSAVWSGQVAPCYFQMSLNRVRPYAADSTRWVMWCLRVLNRRGAFLGDAPGVPHVTAEQLRSTRIPLPSPEEQQNLVRQIDGVAERDRRLAATAETMTARLAEYRESLITEAVTGQLDVTAVSDAEMDERADAAAEGAVAVEGAPAAVG